MSPHASASSAGDTHSARVPHTAHRTGGCGRSLTGSPKATGSSMGMHSPAAHCIGVASDMSSDIHALAEGPRYGPTVRAGLFSFGVPKKRVVLIAHQAPESGRLPLDRVIQALNLA